MSNRAASYTAVSATLFLLALAGCQAAVPVAAAPPAQVETATQEGADPQAPTETAEAPPEPFAASEIPVRADLVTVSLRRIEELVEPASSVAQIADALDEREARVQALRGALDNVNTAQISTRRLEDMRLPWLELEYELAGWAATTQARFDVLQREREYLRDERARWEQTLANAGAMELPPELTNRVAAVVGRVIEVETLVRDRRNAVGALSDRLAGSSEAVADTLRRMQQVADRMRARLLVRDSPPLWRSWGALDARPFAVDAADAAGQWLQGLRGYLRLRPGRALFLVLSFFVVLYGAERLYRQRRVRSEAAGTSDRAERLIERRISLALASALAVTLLILPFPSGSAIDAIFLIALVPVARLGTVVVAESMRPALYAVIGLSLVARIVGLGPDGSPMTRLLLLLVTGLGLGWMVYEGRAVADAGAGRERHPALGVLARVVVVILFAALVANVLGWVQLSRMLTEASIGSLFAAIAWAIVVASMSTLLPMITSGWLGRLLPSFRRQQRMVSRVVVTATTIVAVAAWLRGVAVRFQVAEPLAALIQRAGESAFSIGELTIPVAGLVGGVVILAATWIFSRLVNFILREEVLYRMSLRRGSASSLISLTNYFVWGLGIALTATAVGLTGTQLAVVIGALGVGIGFGLQTIVNNFVSGLILIFERPIKVGDTLQTGETWGRVEHIGIRASTIRSFDGAEIIVPNGDLVSKEVINWTRTDEIRRVEVLVGVAYGTEPEEVLEILRRVAEAHPDVLDEPAVAAQMIRFGESSLDFRLRCWTQMDRWLEVLSDVHVAVNRELKGAGITIPFPQRDLHLISERSNVAPGEITRSATGPVEDGKDHQASDRRER